MENKEKDIFENEIYPEKVVESEDDKSEWVGGYDGNGKPLTAISGLWNQPTSYKPVYNYGELKKETAETVLNQYVGGVDPISTEDVNHLKGYQQNIKYFDMSSGTTINIGSAPIPGTIGVLDAEEQAVIQPKKKILSLVDKMEYKSIRDKAKGRMSTNNYNFSDEDIEEAIGRSKLNGRKPHMILEDILYEKKRDDKPGPKPYNQGYAGAQVVGGAQVIGGKNRRTAANIKNAIKPIDNNDFFETATTQSFKLPSQGKYPSVKDVSPVNKDEEAILNIQELAQELTDIELNGEINPKKEKELLDKYLKIILKHERTKKE